MNKSKDPKRNKPSDKGRDHDPETRDDSAVQPGIQTVSKSDYDKANQQLTDTALGNLSVKKDKNADKRFDEVDKEE
jgi:hypothetical protein